MRKNILLPHQEKALARMHNGCILKGPTGSGKTITALAYYDDNETVERLVVITTAMKRSTGDWQAEARMFGIFPEVDSWQNIRNYEDVHGAFFIFDEQRVVGSGAWAKSFLKITKNNQWILLSATPGDSWTDYIPVFLANGFYETKTEFEREHVVWKPYVRYPSVLRYTGERKLERLLGRILIEMPFEKKTIPHEEFVFCEYDRELYNKVWRGRWNYLEERPVRQVSELFSLIRRIVNSDPSRIDNVRKLMTEHPKMIIFYNFDYELELLRGLDVRKAEWNGHKHEEIPEGDEWVYLVQYSAGSEGWNCIQTDTVVLYSLTYSYRMFHQAKGRIDRLDSPFKDLWYYVLRSSSPVDKNVSAALSRKENFNEMKFLKSAEM